MVYPVQIDTAKKELHKSILMPGKKDILGSGHGSLTDRYTLKISDETI